MFFFLFFFLPYTVKVKLPLESRFCFPHLSHIYSQRVFFLCLFFFWNVACAAAVSIFNSSVVQSVGVRPKINSCLLLVRVAAQMVQPVPHSQPPTKGIQSLETLSLKLYMINPISSQRPWRKRIQFLCTPARWWLTSSLRHCTQGMSAPGTVPGLLFGLLPSNLCSPVQSQPRERLCRRHGSRSETQTFSRGWKGFAVSIPARVLL